VKNLVDNYYKFKEDEKIKEIEKKQRAVDNLRFIES